MCLTLPLDVEIPVIKFNYTNFTVNTDPGLPSAVVTWDTVTATDNSGYITLTSNYQSGDSFTIGITDVIYTAMDPSGNLATTAFKIFVNGIV